MSEVDTQTVEWLWEPYIPFGKVTIVQGNPGEGKTTFALRLAAACTTGGTLPGMKPLPPFQVIYQTAEDGLGDTVKPRLIEAEADLDRVLVIDEAKRELTLSDERIEKAITQNGARLITLGDGYTPADLRAVIAGEKTHTPRKRRTEITVPEKKSGNLLVDIQAKLRAGKGAGYARWATLFNLKQMAQTVAYLQENELLDYTALAEKAAAASARFNDLSAKIKSAETRMAEIAVLRKHIVNYAKSRDTYAAYRKAGYSKKFLAEHESEITLHKAAKNYFDGLGLKKLPTIKALNTEYAELLVEKKAAYADYRKAREDMKELLTAKANIDRILELDKEQEEANERREQEAEQR